MKHAIKNTNRSLLEKSFKRRAVTAHPHAGTYPFALTMSTEEESTDTRTVNIYVDPGV